VTVLTSCSDKLAPYYYFGTGVSLLIFTLLRYLLLSLEVSVTMDLFVIFGFNALLHILGFGLHLVLMSI
jgi:hypothetical protein